MKSMRYKLLVGAAAITVFLSLAALGQDKYQKCVDTHRKVFNAKTVDVKLKRREAQLDRNVELNAAKTDKTRSKAAREKYQRTDASLGAEQTAASKEFSEAKNVTCRSRLTGTVTEKAAQGAVQYGRKLPGLVGEVDYNGATLRVTLKPGYLVGQAAEGPVTARKGPNIYSRAQGNIVSENEFRITQLFDRRGKQVPIEGKGLVVPVYPPTSAR